MNDREIALLTWLVPPIGVMIVKSRAWRLMPGLLRSLFAPALRLPLLLVIAYGSASVMALRTAGLWSLSDLKATLYWGTGYLIVTAYRAMRSPEKIEGAAIMRDILSITVIVEYVAEYQVFPLWIELLISPILMAAALVVGLANEHQRGAKRLAEAALMLFGIAVLAHGLLSIAANWSAFVSPRTAAEFSAPIVLSLMTIPLILVLAAYVAYETAFSLVRIHVKDADLRRYARRAALLAFRFDLRAVRRWQIHVAQTRPSTKAAVSEGIRLITRSSRRARLTRRVPPPTGWDPYEASAYLEPTMPAGEYRCYDSYWASSAFAPSESIGHQNSLMYRVEGDEFAAIRLTLSLFVSDRTKAESARSEFSATASRLLMGLLKWKRIQAQELALSANQDVVVGDLRLRLEVDNCPAADRMTLVVTPATAAMAHLDDETIHSRTPLNEVAR